jgi:hypothetical protein
MTQIGPEGKIEPVISIDYSQIYSKIKAYIPENSEIFRVETGSEGSELEINYSQIYSQIQKYMMNDTTKLLTNP